MPMKKIELYDTTLRDGSQSTELQLTVEDKIKICLKLDDFGIDYIEGGWPGSNPTDKNFFKEIKQYQLKNATVCAFGSTHHPANKASADPNIKALLASGAPAVTIFGKSWDFHVKEALRTSLENNLDIIAASLAELKPHVRELIYDAEHFFDGFKDNREYALATLERARQAGADIIVLCDTNGGSLPSEVGPIMAEVAARIPGRRIGVHVHNDMDLAVANTLAAVQNGAIHVQGTINGYGERCGNANLCSIIPALELKFDGQYICLPEGKLPSLTSLAAYVAEIANVPLSARQPFVGHSAFAHKGGVHVSAINRDARLYEHIDPVLVGNTQKVILSDLAGRSNIVRLARQYGFNLDKDEPVVRGLLADMKDKAAKGYDFAAAEASVELMLLRKLAQRGVRDFFRLIKFSILDGKEHNTCDVIAEAMVMVEVEGEVEHTAATGHGPVNALDNALRKALQNFYPNLKEMKLLDFKVRVLTPEVNTPAGTASNVRVLIESGDASARWVTVGVSYDILEAAWEALADSITYKLYKDEQELHKFKE